MERGGWGMKGIMEGGLDWIGLDENGKGVCGHLNWIERNWLGMDYASI
jgi:hypothetical protein